MPDRVVKLVLTADVQGLVNGFRNAKESAKDFGSNATKFVRDNKESINQASNALLGFGAATVGAVGYVVKQTANFEKSMSGVKAATHESAQNMELLRAAAIDAGADTAYSASEAADAITELAKAGLSTTDILSGGLDGALALAAAGQLDVAQAAGIASSTMNQFGLSGKDVGHIADVLAASAGKANGEVADFGLAMKYVGPVAAQLGISLDETSGALALLAQNGILADSAGTGLRGVLMSLTAPSKAAQKAMAEYSITAFDAQGNFVGLASLAGQLQTQLGGLTEAERSAALGRMFGNEQITAARILYKEGAGAVQDWTKQVSDAGYAAETAALLTDNLSGDIERLGGSLDSVFIKSGSGANDAMRQIVQGAESVVDAIGKIPGPVLSTTTMIAGAGGMAALGVGAAGKMVVGFVNVRDSIQSLGKVAGVAKAAVGGVGAALAVGTIALSAWADGVAEARNRAEALRSTLDDMGNTTDSTLRSLNETLSAKNTVNLWEKIFGRPKDNDTRSAFEMADRLKIAHEDVTRAILGNEDALARVNAAIKATEDVSVWDMDTRDAASSLTKIIDEQTQTLQEQTTEAQRAAAANEAAGVAQSDLAGAVDSTTAAIQAQADAQAELSEAQVKWLADTTAVFDDFTSANGPFQAVIDKNKESAQAAADATKSSKDSWEDFYDGQTVSSQDYISELTRQVEAQEKWAQNITELTTRAAESMPPEMQDAVNSMMDELIRLGPEGAAQVQLLHDMSDEELREVVALYQRQGAATGGQWAEGVESARTPKVDVDTTGASTSIQAWINRWNGFTISGTATIKTGPLAGQPVGSGVLKPGYATGGYTGDGGKYDVAGFVHRGEYVFTKEATARIGVNRLNNWNYGQFPGYANGGPVGGTTTATLGAGSLAAAFDGVELTLVTEAGPLRAFVRAESVSAVAGGLDYEGRASARGGRYGR